MKRKSEIVTFKVDSDLSERLHGIPNKSDFIRAAVLMALDSSCPLCGGSGVLSPAQRNHWKDFSRDHKVRECNRCNEIYLVCEHDSNDSTQGQH